MLLHRRNHAFLKSYTSFSTPDYNNMESFSTPDYNNMEQINQFQHHHSQHHSGIAETNK
jgi:hypothetical protein